MKAVCEGVYFIPGQDEMIPDAHMYVISRTDGGDVTLVDAGLIGKAGYKLDALRALGLDPANVKRIIMTHTHLDHIGCLKELVQALGQVEVWIHRAEGEPLERGDHRTVYGMDMFKSMCHMQYGLSEDAFTVKVDRMLEGGETLELGGVPWEVIHIPGHSAGCIALYDASNRILIPGDVVYADYAIGRFDLHGASGRQLKDSLMRLAELEVDVLLPGHNQIMTRVPRGYVADTARQWAPYLT